MTETTTPSDAELVERLSHLPVERDTAEHYRGYLRRELVMNRCADCGWWHHRPKPICPQCWSHEVVATPISGRGTIHLAIFLYQGPAADGVDYSAGPHPVVTVELEEQEGLRFTSTVVGAENERVVIGAPVVLTWIERDGRPFPAFALVDEP